MAMKDDIGRNIDYMRVSITDKCNLRCRYCMPEPSDFIPHSEILTYEEILKICRAAIELGIDKFKVTGGEPLVRRGAVNFIRELKNLPGADKVTLTTNGILLGEHIDELVDIGIDGINISLDAVSRDKYRELTGDLYDFDMNAAEKCVNAGVKVKFNTVLLADNKEEWLKIAAIAEEIPVDARFIELMPIGSAQGESGPDAAELLDALKTKYPDLEPTGEKRGNGPAAYYKSAGLMGRIGVIGANTHRFCDNCNRIRLTSTGMLKPCLSYNTATDLKTPLRSGADTYELSRLISLTAAQKPAGHCFDKEGDKSERAAMHTIGG